MNLPSFMLILALSLAFGDIEPLLTGRRAAAKAANADNPKNSKKGDSGLPDLVIVNVETQPKSGPQIPYTYTVKNAGVEPISASVVWQTYYRKDRVYDTSDRPAHGVVASLGHLAPGEVVTKNWRYSRWVRNANNRFLIFIVDAKNKIRELSEDNNTYVLDTWTDAKSASQPDIATPRFQAKKSDSQPARIHTRRPQSVVALARTPVMPEKFRLGRWFHQTLGFRLVNLPYVAIPVLAGSLILPLVAWWLRRRQFISSRTQRLAEIGWLVLLTAIAVVSWVMWAIDYCDRIAADRCTPFGYGIFVGIAIFVLNDSGIRRWRVKECLGVKSLFASLLRVTAHFAVFYVCLMTVATIGLSLLLRGAHPIAAHFLPTLVAQFLLLVAFGLYLLCVAWALPATLRQLKKHRNAVAAL